MLPFTALFPSAPKLVPAALRIGSSAVLPFPRLLLPLLLKSAHELAPFLPPRPAAAADGSAWACPRERLLLPSAAAMRCPSCGSGPDLVLIRLSPSEDARIGDSAAADAPPPPASLSCGTAPFLPSPAGLDEADDEALLGTAAAEPKSLSRFLGVSDLVFFLSDLEEEEDAGDAAEAEAGAEVGVRGLLLPSGLDEDSDDLCRDEKKRPLNTIASSRRAPPAPGREFRRTGGGSEASDKTD